MMSPRWCASTLLYDTFDRYRLVAKQTSRDWRWSSTPVHLLACRSLGLQSFNVQLSWTICLCFFRKWSSVSLSTKVAGLMLMSAAMRNRPAGSPGSRSESVQVEVLQCTSRLSHTTKSPTRHWMSKPTAWPWSMTGWSPSTATKSLKKPFPSLTLEARINERTNGWFTSYATCLDHCVEYGNVEYFREIATIALDAVPFPRPWSRPPPENTAYPCLSFL